MHRRRKILIRTNSKDQKQITDGKLKVVASIFAAVLFCTPLAADAASWESLISPGPLTQLHADLEEDCSACHSPFDRERQNTLCIECHEEIGQDLEIDNGFHGKNPAITPSSCNQCHTDHEGRDADITGLVESTFNHAFTNFQLQGQHTDLSCVACHAQDQPFRGTATGCVDCHKEDDVHAGGLGEECASCHQETGWSEVTFDHFQQTEFELVGAHAEQACASCHIDQVYTDTPSECVDCHKLDDVHQGARGDECGSCHTSVDWQSSEFDHNQETDFDLLGAHSELVCTACHLDNMKLVEPPLTCVGCHSTDDVHTGSRGTACGDCHNNTSWSLEFDHLAETGFELRDSHSELHCDACHAGDLQKALPTNCVGCHEGDDPHGQTLGECDSCHASASWVESVRFDHEFTQFPLVGLHQLAVCEQCHESLEFSTAQSACDSCHADDDAHAGVFGRDCETCHNPGGWQLWDFDHDSQTSFELTGAHNDLVCEACHTKNSGKAENLTSNCSTCHAKDDIHNGGFGTDCSQCHTTDSFADNVRFR